MSESKSSEKSKQDAARHAIEFIEDGMIVGLGTGSTANYFLKFLGKAVREGLDIQGIPSSLRTEQLAMEYKIPLTDFSEHKRIDITVDGADEVDNYYNLIKGGGGALLREKIIAYHSNTLVIIVDGNKLVNTLGEFPVPVEVTRFGWEATLNRISQLGCKPIRRMIRDESFVTENSNYILDCHFDQIRNPERLEREIRRIPGIVENGLFIGLAGEVIVGKG